MSKRRALIVETTKLSFLVTRDEATYPLGMTLDTPPEAVEIARHVIGAQHTEILIVMFLDARNAASRHGTSSSPRSIPTPAASSWPTTTRQVTSSRRGATVSAPSSLRRRAPSSASNSTITSSCPIARTTTASAKMEGSTLVNKPSPRMPRQQRAAGVFPRPQDRFRFTRVNTSETHMIDEDLMRAAQVVRKHGISWGYYFNPRNERVCLVGAYGLAVGAPVRNGRIDLSDLALDPGENSSMERVLTRIEQERGRAEVVNEGSVVVYNDHHSAWGRNSKLGAAEKTEAAARFLEEAAAIVLPGEVEAEIPVEVNEPCLTH